MLLSYQTKVKGISKEVSEFLDEFASLYSNIERRYYVDVFKNKETRGGLKKSYTKTYQITARHYNAIAINTDGKIKSKEEIISEEMGVLYVALTRAKERLIVTGISKDLEKDLKEKEELLSLYFKEDKINNNIFMYRNKDI